MIVLQRIALFLVIIVFGSIILREGSFILVPLVWGVFFAFSLHPISSWFEEKKFPRSIAIIISILMVAVIVTGIFYVLLNQMVGLIRDIPEIGQNLQNKMSLYLDELNVILGNEILDPGNRPEVWSFLTPENFNTTLFNTGKSLTLAGIIPLYIFLLLYYEDFFLNFLIRFSSKNKDRVLNWVMESGKVIQSYLTGMVKVTLIVAVMAGLFFFIIGVKYFLLFAAFIAIMNLIPYVGVFISSFFAILYVFLTTDNLLFPFLTFGVLWAIQLFENNVITPLVVGSQVKVNALAVILAILLGGWLWGISGMILFIPLVGVLKITFENSEGLEPFGFLLSDETMVPEKNQLLKKKFWKSLFEKK
ncbi:MULTISPECIES: AI-2E family transporter [Algoriphagus]|jgi:predicted PurR-regulated permease PerM|uniref:AI-2E family transporter n=3 Tax=Cyclobacteriaceae TaxID=563798 RepID=UPI000C6B2FFF|nr:MULTISPECIES: AI-2E family transporter [Algoriphagus]MAL15219.1 AI-2E family transporter [Algoriphagus sp.]QYH37846.1 AI-2E family transporter [Algoriphagus sp. NBT04N3]HAD49814.1 AI-2E family transporter [Algoriphagus sp.]HAH39183.1 AI-2E family transporter [Algoriphagus sp.]HAS59882.1 AI-2E family transporter [Algoriphagus sp.]|tara:strand:- start:370 stop:1452 length:1083 start_codon:yes stop_codon:yes gene_type:complete